MIQKFFVLRRLSVTANDQFFLRQLLVFIGSAVFHFQLLQISALTSRLMFITD